MSIGLVTSQGVTWASPDGSRIGEGAGWLQQNPSMTKTPNWVPGPGKKLLEVTPRNSGPFTKNQVGSKANATPMPLPGPRSATRKTRVVRRDASRLAPGPNSSPVPQPLPTPSKAGIVRRAPPSVRHADAASLAAHRHGAATDGEAALVGVALAEPLDPIFRVATTGRMSKSAHFFRWRCRASRITEADRFGRCSSPQVRFPCRWQGGQSQTMLFTRPTEVRLERSTQPGR